MSHKEKNEVALLAALGKVWIGLCAAHACAPELHTVVTKPLHSKTPGWSSDAEFAPHQARAHAVRLPGCGACPKSSSCHCDRAALLVARSSSSSALAQAACAPLPWVGYGSAPLIVLLRCTVRSTPPSLRSSSCLLAGAHVRVAWSCMLMFASRRIGPSSRARSGFAARSPCRRPRWHDDAAPLDPSAACYAGRAPVEYAFPTIGSDPSAARRSGPAAPSRLAPAPPVPDVGGVTKNQCAWTSTACCAGPAPADVELLAAGFEPASARRRVRRGLRERHLPTFLTPPHMVGLPRVSCAAGRVRRSVVMVRSCETL
ncbi:hypothetical protein AURDEDRAFT_163522 [Auricularia subglabra TFB-10046 SS5]|nr:hypothetical protein AURDEDRAFT_163522 [Auricularia subglabra TFB-10046 SS5]